jgi:hypothetical protein
LDEFLVFSFTAGLSFFLRLVEAPTAAAVVVVVAVAAAPEVAVVAVLAPEVAVVVAVVAAPDVAVVAAVAEAIAVPVVAPRRGGIGGMASVDASTRRAIVVLVNISVMSFRTLSENGVKYSQLNIYLNPSEFWRH